MPIRLQGRSASGLMRTGSDPKGSMSKGVSGKKMRRKMSIAGVKQQIDHSSIDLLSRLAKRSYAIHTPHLNRCMSRRRARACGLAWAAGGLTAGPGRHAHGEIG